MTKSKIAVVCATNDEPTAARNLLSSPDLLEGGVDVIMQPGEDCAGKTLNRGMDRADASVIVFAHQDVYFPTGWLTRLLAGIEQLNRTERWGVIGVWGVDAQFQYHGRVWCSGGNLEHVGSGSPLAPVKSIDEIVIVVNASTGLRFDERLPGFHLYATDIILQAAKAGYGSFVIDAPVIHNSRPNPDIFDRHFFAAYAYMQRKWADQLPLQTCTVEVTRYGSCLWRAWLKRKWLKMRGQVALGRRWDDPAVLAKNLGYELKQVPT